VYILVHCTALYSTDNDVLYSTHNGTLYNILYSVQWYSVQTRDDSLIKDCLSLSELFLQLTQHPVHGTAAVRGGRRWGELGEGHQGGQHGC
jgi:hypothetical protein